MKNFYTNMFFMFGFSAVHCSSERRDGEKACSRLPRQLELFNQTYLLPNPFKLINGDAVHSLKDWHCRTAQIKGSQSRMHYETLSH